MSMPNNIVGPKIVKLPSVVACPYRVCRTTCEVVIPLVEERFDFQISESGKIDRISLGEFDLVKEVNSHNGEVGLINVVKLATAVGKPLDFMAKTEPGIMVNLDEIDTLDELMEAQKANEAKLAKFASTLGITVDELVNIVKSGDISKLTPSETPEEDKGE